MSRCPSWAARPGCPRAGTGRRPDDVRSRRCCGAGCDGHPWDDVSEGVAWAGLGGLEPGAGSRCRALVRLRDSHAPRTSAPIPASENSAVVRVRASGAAGAARPAGRRPGPAASPPRRPRPRRSPMTRRAATPAKPAAPRVRALADLKVVEFGGFAAGPAIGKHLADHGAEVIHVESRLHPDGFRTNYPPYADNRPGPERAAMFAITNNDKLGITLNLKSPGAHGVAVRLIERADVVIENFTPGTMERLGLDHAAMSERNPGLVTLSTCNQGATGPHAGRAGFGTHLTALSGFTNLTGWPDRAPALLWGPFIDYIAVAYGAVAVLAALDERARTGRGCHVDLSQYEAGIQFMAPVLATWFSGGQSLERAGNRHVTAVPHAVFPCAGEQRWCAISVHDDEEWRRLRAALGSPDWAADPALDGVAGRRAAEAWLEERISGWTRARAREDVVAALRSAAVHVAPVNDMSDVFRDEQLVHRRAFRLLDHSEIGRHSVPGPSFVLPATPDCVESAAPLLGQHNREVLCGILGLSEDDVADLEAEGALE